MLAGFLKFLIILKLLLILLRKYLYQYTQSLSGRDWCFEKFSRQVSSYCAPFLHSGVQKNALFFPPLPRRNEISTITYAEGGRKSAFVRARARNSKKSSLIVLGRSLEERELES